jgi:hypothetical protein
MPSSPHCGITAALVASAYAVGRSGLGTIAAPRRFKCMFCKRYGTYVMLMTLMIVVMRIQPQIRL